MDAPSLTFMFSAFVAGFLMFVAPCTLPLIPGYIAFISGIKEADLSNGKQDLMVRLTVLKNAFAFTLGFSLIFILFGLIAGLFGQYIGAFKVLLSELAGILVIIFGLTLLNIFSLPVFSKYSQFHVPSFITPGTQSSSFVIGAAFALGWTPCIGPVVASILLFASLSSTAFYGALLLAIFSLGLSVPFLLTALAFTQISKLIYKYQHFSKILSKFGAVFLIIIGILLLTQTLGLTLSYGYALLDQFGFGWLQHFY